MGTGKSYELFWFHCCAQHNQEAKKKVFQKQSGLIHITWNRGCAWRGDNDALFIYICIFYWVVVLSRCHIRGMGSTFYFRNAQWPNLQQHSGSGCLKKIYHDPLCISVWYSSSCGHCSTPRLDTAEMRVLPLVSVWDSVGSGLCVVTSVRWDCPLLSRKDEPQHFPAQDAGQVIT